MHKSTIIHSQPSPSHYLPTIPAFTQEILEMYMFVMQPPPPMITIFVCMERGNGQVEGLLYIIVLLGHRTTVRRRRRKTPEAETDLWFEGSREGGGAVLYIPLGGNGVKEFEAIG